MIGNCCSKKVCRCGARSEHGIRLPSRKYLRLSGLRATFFSRSEALSPGTAAHSAVYRLESVEKPVDCYDGHGKVLTHC